VDLAVQDEEVVGEEVAAARGRGMVPAGVVVAAAGRGGMVMVMGIGGDMGAGVLAVGALGGVVGVRGGVGAPRTRVTMAV